MLEGFSVPEFHPSKRPVIERNSCHVFADNKSANFMHSGLMNSLISWLTSKVGSVKKPKDAHNISADDAYLEVLAYWTDPIR